MIARGSTQIVGIRLPEEIAVAFKKEAAGRNVRLNKLFQEMWKLYQQAMRKDRVNDGSQPG